jgi:hypothetical protein
MFIFLRMTRTPLILSTGVSNKCPRKMMFDELTVIQPLKQALGGLVEIIMYYMLLPQERRQSWHHK